MSEICARCRERCWARNGREMGEMLDERWDEIRAVHGRDVARYEIYIEMSARCQRDVSGMSAPKVTWTHTGDMLLCGTCTQNHSHRKPLRTLRQCSSALAARSACMLCGLSGGATCMTAGRDRTDSYSTFCSSVVWCCVACGQRGSG